MKKNVFLKAGVLLLSLLLLPGLSGCGAISSLVATPTPTPLPPGEVRGTLVNSSGEPLANLRIFLINADVISDDPARGVLETDTDEFGRFVFQNVPPGRCKIVGAFSSTLGFETGGFVVGDDVGIDLGEIIIR